MDERTYELLTRKIAELLDLDLQSYKAPQMQRRLAAWVTKRAKGEDPATFVRALGSDPALVADLRDVLTINVSEFFRDPRQWEVLRTEILPELLERNPRLRIWSAACSNGQEPFSLAMTLEEMGIANRARIMATDMDRGVLAKARAGGPYPPNEMKQLSSQQRAKYFEERDGGHYVNDAIRKAPSFSELNLLTDRFNNGYHLISCRHVMIYFSPEVKMQLLQRLGQSLAPGGYLFIGGSESLVGDEREGYRLARGNFYQRTSSGALRAA